MLVQQLLIFAVAGLGMSLRAGRYLTQHCPHSNHKCAYHINFRWKNGAQNGEDSVVQKALSSPYVIVSILVIGLLTLYYLNRRLIR
ncbi:hypothetical protein Y032_0003g1611 [Ancylostoma ceylanicum]|uniref:Uncharacterized protein n=1 Tax=Ancylostoma ceylanicum TaxID=53326 RepID=A0A016VY38_9BILA|nr:hypothetical protein Y032_0003g1611 [Ancylostoma ceylanicum]